VQAPVMGTVRGVQRRFRRVDQALCGVSDMQSNSDEADGKPDSSQKQ
jgi:hypothetical protein